MIKKLFKKVDIHKEIFHKVIFYKKYICQDEFGWPDDEKHKFEFYFKISKVFTLSGIVYRVQVPDLTVHDKNMFLAIWEAIKNINDDGPRYYRLKEELYRKGFIKHL